MANPEMWKLQMETHCSFGCGGPLLPEDLYDDEEDALQIAAGEEDQSVPDWENV